MMNSFYVFVFIALIVFVLGLISQVIGSRRKASAQRRREVFRDRGIDGYDPNEQWGNER